VVPAGPRAPVGGYVAPGDGGPAVVAHEPGVERKGRSGTDPQDPARRHWSEQSGGRCDTPAHRPERPGDETPQSVPPGVLRVRFFAAARDAAGVPSMEVPAGMSLDALLAHVLDAHAGDAALARVLERSTFLVDGLRRDRGDPAPLATGTTVDVLPPFAGG